MMNCNDNLADVLLLCARLYFVCTAPEGHLEYAVNSPRKDGEGRVCLCQRMLLVTFVISALVRYLQIWWQYIVFR